VIQDGDVVSLDLGCDKGFVADHAAVIVGKPKPGTQQQST
jgi:methionine aminopeptidase